MGISTFTSKEFVIFCQVSKIGNDQWFKGHFEPKNFMIFMGKSMVKPASMASQSIDKKVSLIQPRALFSEGVWI